MLVFRCYPWATYFALQAWTSQERIGPSAARLSFDTSRAGSLPKEIPPGSPVEIVIPVRLDYVPQGIEVEEDRSSITIEGRNGKWHSGWFPYWVLGKPSRPEPWLAISVDKQFYELNRDFPVRLTLDAAFTLIRKTRPTIRVTDGITDITGFGQCRVSRFGDRPDTRTCYSPAFQPVAWGDTIYLYFRGIPTTPSFDPLYASQTDTAWSVNDQQIHSHRSSRGAHPTYLRGEGSPHE
jgi:hypothetical protein